MRVKNLVSWAGADFSCAPGQLIELPDDVAAARIEAGLAAPTRGQRSRQATAAEAGGSGGGDPGGGAAGGAG